MIEMGPGSDYRVSPLVLPPDYLKALQDNVLLGFTGLTRVASEVARAQIENIENGQSRMDEVMTIAREALDLVNRRADFDGIGKLLDHSWEIKRSFAAGVSSREIDSLYAVARGAGAWGGKLLGAGGGGFMMFLAPPKRHEGIKEALRPLRVWVPSTFATDGARVVFHTDDY